MVAVPASKDSDRETPVPTAWHDTFTQIVDRLIGGDFELAGIEGAQPISAPDAKRIEENISDYGSALAPLPIDTWQTSACRWIGPHWIVLVDLFAMDRADCDLVLFANVYEEPSGYTFDVTSVHVP